MTKFFAAGLGIVFLLGLAGCNPPKATPSPTAQSTLTVAIPTVTATVDITLTPSQTVQNTPTVPFPTLTTYSQSAYTLQRPDLQQFVSLISAVRAQADQDNYSDDWKSEVISEGISAQDDFIAADLRRYYADSIPNASQYIDKMPADWDDLFHAPSKGIYEILFHHSLVDFFNEKQVQFVDKQEQKFTSFNALAYALGIDGKTWLIQVDLTAPQWIRSWLTLRKDQDGKYQIIPNDMGIMTLEFADYSTELITNVDINNDGRDDIVKWESHYSAGGMSQRLFIYTANAQGFSLLDTIYLPKAPPIFDEAYQSEYKIGDYNHDGLKDIQITSPEFELFDCRWEKRLIVQFKEAKRTDQTTNGDIPHKPECALARMLNSHQPDEMAYLLAVAKANLKKDASSDLRTWIQLRLAMVDYAQGKDQQAIQALDAIAKIPVKGKGGFQKAVQDAYQQAGPFPLRVCEILSEVAEKKERSGGDNFDSDIDIDLAAFGAYPITITPIPYIVCPYMDIISARLKTVKDKTTTADEIFAHLGLQLFPLYQVNFDTDDDPEWIGLLGEDSAKLVFIDRKDDEWRMIEDSAYEEDKSNLQVKNLDVNGDGQGDIILSFAYDLWYAGSCDGGKQRFLLEIFDPKDEYYDAMKTKEFDCTDQSPLDQLSDQEIMKLPDEADSSPVYQRFEYPSWAKFRRVDGEELTILNDIDDLEKAVIENTQPEDSRAKIEALLASLPENDTTADLLRERLAYLSGYRYELQGDNEKALAIYLSLIEKNPQSLWSGLAESRLSSKP